MVAYRKKGSGKKLINAKEQVVDGIKLKSRLEAYMFVALKKAGIPFSYEEVSFVVLDSFVFKNESFERKSNGTGDLIDRGLNKKVLEIKYTPDFVGDGFIIETKGLRTESFNLRFKMFKKYLNDNNFKYSLYMPQTQTECDKVIQLILNKTNNDSKTSK
jgi:hypothetical protein